MKRFMVFFCVFLLCVSFGTPSLAAPVERTGEQPGSLGGLYLPSSPGRVRYTGGGAALDASNVSEGYITAGYSGGSDQAKVRVIHGGVTNTYNLRTDGVYEVFPLTGGDGVYQVEIYGCVHGDQYALELSQTLSVELRDPMLPYLYPNQRVNFSAGSSAVAKAAELSRPAGSTLEVVSNVYNYIIGNVAYDAAKAGMASAGRLPWYVPDVDGTLRTQKGICYDYAALMTAMLRSQGIPTCMDVGYVSGGVYHAWLDTYVPEVGWINGVIRFDGENWTLMDPTFAAGAGARYAGDGVSYRAVYRY